MERVVCRYIGNDLHSIETIKQDSGRDIHQGFRFIGRVVQNLLTKATIKNNKVYRGDSESESR